MVDCQGGQKRCDSLFFSSSSTPVFQKAKHKTSAVRGILIYIYGNILAEFFSY